MFHIINSQLMWTLSSFIKEQEVPFSRRALNRSMPMLGMSGIPPCTHSLFDSRKAANPKLKPGIACLQKDKHMPSGTIPFTPILHTSVELAHCTDARACNYK